MKVDPNQSIDTRCEMVLCERGELVEYTGARSPLAELANATSSFRGFCAALDPNKDWILALVPLDQDREVFFAAREVAQEYGLHMQAPVETAERCRELWAGYLSAKAAEARGQTGNRVTPAEV